MISAEGNQLRFLRLAFEGEQVTPTQGENYATHASLSSVRLRFCVGRDSAFSADRFTDARPISAEHELTRREQ